MDNLSTGDFLKLENMEPILVAPWVQHGFDPIYQICMWGRSPPIDGVWPIYFPERIQWTDRTIVLMHATDFFQIRQDNPNHCAELQSIQDHFGDRANQVVVLHKNMNLQNRYQGPLHLIYFPSVFFMFCHNINLCKDLWIDQFDQPRTKIWQCLNGRIDDRRRLVYDLLKGLDQGVLNLGNEVPLEILDYTGYRDVSNEENFITLLPIYQDCDINVVTETCYAAGDGGITEKSLMAFLALQIPLFIGHQGYVGNLEEQGFDVFSDIVDTGYDRIENNRTRILSALESNRHLLTQGIDRNKYLQRLGHNQTHALTGWRNDLLIQYDRRITEIHDYLTKP